MELYLDPIINVEKKRAPRYKIHWTEEQLEQIRTEFPVTFTKVLAKKMGLAFTTLAQKAYSMGVYKVENFNIITAKERGKLIKESVRPPNPYKGRKGWSVPGGEKNQFRKGHNHSPLLNRETVERVTKSRRESVRRDKIRLSLGLPQKTKIKLLPL